MILNLLCGFGYMYIGHPLLDVIKYIQLVRAD